MADRPTVTLPLVWRGDELRHLREGNVGRVVGDERNGFYALVYWPKPIQYRWPHPNRSAAMRAVEEAVMRALGAEG